MKVILVLSMVIAISLGGIHPPSYSTPRPYYQSHHQQSHPRPYGSSSSGGHPHTSSGTSSQSISFGGARHSSSQISYGGSHPGSSVITSGRPVSFTSHPVAHPAVHPAVHPSTGHHAGGYGLVDATFGYSVYHGSWLHGKDGEYEWEEANYYCNNLGPGWRGLSIETKEESYFINDIIYKHGLKYIWTCGQKHGYGFSWCTGEAVQPINWAQTGAKGLPQPDNNEGNENYLAILNHFYPNDGITWHDIAGHHLKPIICERPRHSGGYRY